MAAERKTGAGSHLGGVLERATPPRPPAAPVAEVEAEAVEPADEGDGAEPIREPKAAKGRGEAARPRARTGGVKAAKVKGRTIYLPDDLFERIMVQAHRRDKTISDYVTAILERQVPDHRGRDVGEVA